MDNELIEKIKLAQEGNKEVLNELVKDNFGLVYSISKRFYNRGYEAEDINQIGAIGLIKAIKKFDFSYNVALSTFAVAYIIGEIKRFLRDDGPIKVSRELKKIATQIGEERRLNEKITIKELAEKLGVGEDEIILALETNNAPESLESKIDEDGLCLMDRLKSNDEGEEKIVRNIALLECLKRLDERERKIIYLRYFKSKTQKDVADAIGMSQVQISRLESKILKSLKNELIDA